jgi:hypothetical protein
MTSRPGIPDRWLRSIRASLSRNMYRNGFQDNPLQSFITRERLLEVWLDNKDGSCPLDELQLYIPIFSQHDILEHLLRVISILVFIFWDDWSSLADHFGFESNKFTDQNVPLSPEQCKKVFSQSPCYQAEFHQAQFAFVPVFIKQNEHLRLRNPNLRLPLSSEGQPNETGSYGTVTKVAIAKGYFLKEDGAVHNKVSIDSVVAMKWDTYLS